MTLLEQLSQDLPTQAHQIRVYLDVDTAKAEEIASRVRELRIASIRYVMQLERFEQRPPEGHPKRAAYDILVAALEEVTPHLKQLPAVERSGD